MNFLETYYNEHATQARQHENYRERMTNILIAVAALLVGLITNGKLSLWTLPASAALSLLGIFGFLFAGKHYERFRMHTSIMNAIRDEMDKVAKEPGYVPPPLSKIRDKGEEDHYKGFKWPQIRSSARKRQDAAGSWIARQRLHTFWEALPLALAVFGIVLSAFVIFNALFGHPPEPTRIQLLK